MKEGWEYKKLGEIATEMYRGSGIKRDQVTKEGTPCVRYGEIYTTYNISFDTCVSHTNIESITSPKYFEHGDLLFAITGESVEDIGKTIAYLGDEKIKNSWQFWILTGWIVLTAGLIEREPDLGTALSICIVFMIMLYISGAKLSDMAWLTGLGASVVSAILIFGGNSYRIKRLTSFLDPWKDSQDSGYHVCQSIIAIGSGGFGLGLGESRQKYFYLPEQHTDFVFAITGEELGIIGTLIIILLFCFFLHRGFKIASETSDLFLRLLAVGCTLMITLQAFMNIGVVIGLLPCTGIPLPFISYGGSSLMVTLMMVGLLFNISQYCSRDGIGLQLDDEKSDYDFNECLDAEED